MFTEALKERMFLLDWTAEGRAFQATVMLGIKLLVATPRPVSRCCGDNMGRNKHGVQSGHDTFNIIHTTPEETNTTERTLDLEKSVKAVGILPSKRRAIGMPQA